MDRYSLSVIAGEAMSSVREQSSLLQDEFLQERIASVRERIAKVREYARRKDVPLDEIEAFDKLERAIGEAPSYVEHMLHQGSDVQLQRRARGQRPEFDLGEPRRDDTYEGRPSTELANSTGNAYHPPPRLTESQRDGERDWERDYNIEGIIEEVTSRKSVVDNTLPSTSSGRYSDHFGSFQNLSLGDVLSSSRTTRLSKTKKKHELDESRWEPQGPSASSRLARQSLSPTSSEQGSSQANPGSSDGGEKVLSFGELLSTSRKPNLRDKIRQAQEQDFSLYEPIPSSGRGAARAAPETESFGGSLGDILRTRDESEHRDRTRFISRSSDIQLDEEGRDGGEIDGTRSREQANARVVRAGANREYKNDKSLANRALCRLNRVRFKGTSESKQECAICLENFRHGQVLACFGTGCKHSFHQSCIIAWFKTGDTRCPLCRFDPITGTWP